MIKRSLTCILLAAGLLVPAASASAQTSSPPPPRGELGIRLVDAPVSRENDPRAKTYIVDHLAQGTTINRHVEVVNETSNPQTVQLYAGGAVIGNGQFAGLEGHAGNELTGWTSITPSLLSLNPGQSAQAEVTIAVPQGAQDGERYGVIWAETATPAAGGSVTVLNRVGVRVYLSVGTGAEPVSDFVI
ncbi:MAG: hypothetical protein JOZ04_15360, partial [Acidimicrobiia bacterium]|nr:hypothetical protein [Acidimicrobiia bacterium]